MTQETLNWITVIGTLASLIGVIITLFQIFRVKKISQLTKQSVSNTTREINKIYSLINLTKNVEDTKSIQDEIIAKKYDVALYKIRELHCQLLEFYQQITIIEMQDKVILQQTISDFEDLLSNLQTIILEPSSNNLNHKEVLTRLNKALKIITILKVQQKTN